MLDWGISGNFTCRNLKVGVWLTLFSIISLSFLSRPSLADGILMKTNSETLFHHVGTNVHVTIDEQVASTVVDFSFENNSVDDSIWAKFAFPVPEKAVVTDFGVYKKDQIWFYKIGATDTAHGNQGVPQEDERLKNYLGPNSFLIAVKIGKGVVRFRLKYVQVVDYVDGANVYSYPLDTRAITSAPLDTFSFDLSLFSAHTILSAQCVSHSWYTFQVGENTASLVFSRGDFPVDRDVTVRYRLEQPDIEATVFSYRTPSDPVDNAGYFAVIFRPPSPEHARILSKYFVFLIDKSGSMSGDRIEYAKRAAKSCIWGLDKRDIFNVIWFNGTYGSFSVAPVPALDVNKQQAIDFINSLSASGSTNLYSPTLAAVQQARADRVNQIVLLTDGYHNTGPVVNHNEVIRRITSANVHNARIFCFGVSQGADFTFLAKLAEANHGTSFKIERAERIEPVVEEFFEAVNEPVLQVDSASFVGIEPFEVYPKVLPDIAIGNQLIITGRYTESGNGTMLLHVRVAGKDTVFTYGNIFLPDSSVAYPFVRKLWAKQKIDYLYQQWLAQGQPEGLRQQIIELSIVYGVLSPFTEFSEPVPPSTPVEDAGILAGLRATVLWETGLPQVRITWTGTADEAEDVVTVWRIGASGLQTLVAKVPFASGEVVDRDVESGGSYRYRLEVTDASGEIVARRELTVRVPERFGLSRAYPNPFNSQTSFSLVLPDRGVVTVEVCDLLGRKIRQLFRGEVRRRRRLRWDGRNDAGQDVPSGLYIVRATRADKVWIQKVALVR